MNNRKPPASNARTRAAFPARAFPARAFCALALVALAFPAAPHARAQQSVTIISPGAAAPPDSTKGTGTINVRIVGDDNQPLPNAFVMAFQQGAGGRASSDNSGAATGNYVLTNLNPGVYSISANAPGYVVEADPAADPSRPPNLYRPGDSVTIRLTKGGVITGKVTDAAGEPVVGARVGAMRLRDATGRVLRGAGARERRTDDRGVYRLYGLPAGSYVVFAGGRGQWSFMRPSAYDSDAPTYYPSATRDGAAEVQVQPGQEVADVDVRHRGEQGYTVSGTVAGKFGTGEFGAAGASVTLTHVPSGAAAAFAYISGSHEENRSFTFDGVADGDYDVAAASGSGGQSAGFASAPLRVSVRGADVTGLRLALAPLASLSGRLAFEPASAADAARAECQNRRAPVPQELLVFTRREDAAAQAGPAAGPREAAPGAGGDFTLRNLEAGRYRLALRLLDDSIFVRAITLPAGATNVGAAPGAAAPPPAARVASDLARNGVGLKSGEQLGGVTITVGVVAASLRGRVAPAAEGEGLPERLRVHLVPAERERADDVIRYAETLARPDGTFAFRNVAPGRYLLVARPASESELRQAEPPRPAAWDAATRAELRREAEAAKNSVELQPCQRAEDFALRLIGK